MTCLSDSTGMGGNTSPCYPIDGSLSGFTPELSFAGVCPAVARRAGVAAAREGGLARHTAPLTHHKPLTALAARVVRQRVTWLVELRSRTRHSADRKSIPPLCGASLPAPIGPCRR